MNTSITSEFGTTPHGRHYTFFSPELRSPRGGATVADTARFSLVYEQETESLLRACRRLEDRGKVGDVGGGGQVRGVRDGSGGARSGAWKMRGQGPA